MENGFYGFPTPGRDYNSPFQLVSTLPTPTPALRGQLFLLQAQIAAATGYQDAVYATAGLTNYWKLDEVAGTTLTDSKGTRNGTYSGIYTLGQMGATPDVGNRAVLFGGGNGSVTNGSADWVGGAMSLEFWYYSTSSSNTSVCGLRNNTTADFYCDILNSTQLECRFRNSSGTAFTLNPSPGAFSTWHHGVMVYDGSTTLSAYIDGALAAQTTSAGGTISSTTSAMTFAKDVQAPNFAGRLDEVAAYNVALSPTTILSHYTIGTAASTPDRFYSVIQKVDGTYQWVQIPTV
ncbi:hypothetical protein CCAX7_000300 [Capsulimonas corticalis]|uniref:Uncharacterized protein n=1 Tax=Capsulimonas corticalis TaxID=2219043 RepID=A0A402CRB4_9BACT|nr:LamG domain-containing protein [Capsulimonas corticalis]BDI27979.1 hypothetical protein CCAX7_000300 [Capsulimonas corticalis]